MSKTDHKLLKGLSINFLVATQKEEGECRKVFLFFFLNKTIGREFA